MLGLVHAHDQLGTGLTKMVSKLSKEGGFRKGLEVFQALPELGIAPDTAITNSAISACDKGAPQRTRARLCGAARRIVHGMQHSQPQGQHLDRICGGGDSCLDTPCPVGSWQQSL